MPTYRNSLLAFALALTAVPVGAQSVDPFAEAQFERGSEARVTLRIPFGGDRTSGARSEPRLGFAVMPEDVQRSGWMGGDWRSLPDGDPWARREVALTLSGPPTLLVGTTELPLVGDGSVFANEDDGGNGDDLGETAKKVGIGAAAVVGTAVVVIGGFLVYCFSDDDCYAGDE